MGTANVRPTVWTARGIGVLYLLFSFILTSRLHWDVALIEFLIFAGGLWGYSRYQEGYSSKAIVLVAAAQALAHMVVIVSISWLALWINGKLLSWVEWHWLGWLIYLALFMFTLGRWLAGYIFGWNLLITCRHFDMNHNDAFSAMQIDSHRHFLRLRILGDAVTVYPIKIEQVPRRNDWRKNPERLTNPAASVFSPTRP
jgi:hypothetical protein